MRGMAAVVAMTLITLSAVSRPALGQTSTDDRLRALEDQLREALKQLGEQRDATRRAEQEIGELSRELKQQRAHV